MIKWALHIIQFCLLLISPFVMLAFFVGLTQKVLKPNFKNLPTNEYIISGIILLALLVSDYFFIRNRFKRQK